ncbi:MAG: hypothetical protein KGY76_02570 [Candidatus Thermoplasmatota archaeon]|nr:hypothetical protein [Candidatus Thermoplasmatota archaeon]
MIRKDLDDQGKVPFALVGVVLLVLSGITFALVGDIEESERDISIYTPTEETSAAAGETLDDIATRAYHLSLQRIHNLTKNRDPEMFTLQAELEKDLKGYLNETYPLNTENCLVYIDNWSVKIVSESRTTLETDESFSTGQEFIEPFQAEPKKEAETNISEFQEGKAPLYGRVVGNIEMSVYSEGSGQNVTYHKDFEKNVYSPVFYLRSRFREFRSESKSSFGEVGKLIRYQLSSITQMRTLFGNASGGYGENEGNITSLLSEEDVERAVNLALLLEAARLYGDYDEDIAKKMGIDSELQRYADNGTVDAADLFLMHRNIKKQEVDAGKVLSQAIYPFGEDFVLDLYELFWGDKIVDPTLSEPVVNWQELEDKGEDWAEEQVRTWLKTYREWLGIPETLDPQDSSSTIQKMEGSMSPYEWTCVQNPEAPRPVGGHYWVFSRGPYDFTSGEWEMRSSEVPDTIDLILGDPENDNLDPEPYELTFNSDFSNVGDRTIEYYLVEESLIAKHDEDQGTPYFDTLKYILQTINRSVRQRSKDIEEETNKGFMDTISSDIADSIGTKKSDFEIDPEDNRSVLVNGTGHMIEEEGSIHKALKEFKDKASGFDKRDEWWSEGAYKKEHDDDFMYHLTKETVDLWYEAVVNLYDGGVKDMGRNPGSLSTDPPEEEQHSEGDSSEGSFAFRQDAMKDVNERVRDIAIPRRRSFKDEAWETTVGEPCWSCEECLRYRNTVIPNDAKSTWTDQAIWNRLWNDIEDGTDRVVGEQGLLSQGQISQKLMDDMDKTTDEGNYEGDHQTQGNFYDFVGENVAVRTIGEQNERENMLLNLSQKNGWLQQKFNRTLRSVKRNTHVNQERRFLATNMTQPRYNWRMNRSYDRKRQRLLNETFTVEFSDYLTEGDNLSIDIDYPEKGQHFVDVQGRYSGDLEERTNMSWSPYQTALNVSIEGTLEVNTTTDRRNIPVGVHRSTWYNGTLDLKQNFTLPLHTAQPLESDWLENDVDYRMTRRYFNLIDEEDIQSDRPLKEDAIYISRPMMNLSRAMTDVLARSSVTTDSVRTHLRGCAHSTVSKPLHSAENLSEFMKTIDEVSYETYNDTSYFEFIDDHRRMLADRNMDRLEYPYMGFDLDYNVENSPLKTEFQSNNTRISFDLGQDDYVYEVKRHGSIDLSIEVDPSKDERVVIHADQNTTLDNYSFDLRYPQKTISLDEAGLRSIKSSIFSNISLPNLGGNYSIDVGLRTTEGELPDKVHRWIESSVEERNDTYEGFIRFSKRLLREMNDDSDVLKDLENVGFYLDIDGNMNRTYIYWTNQTEKRGIKSFSRMLINRIRDIGRELGASNPAPSIFARIDKDGLNNRSFEVLGAEGNYTKGNLAWWASSEPSIGVGRKGDYFIGEVGRADKNKYIRFGKVYCEPEN